jgi:hypothetical protein
MRIRSRRSWRNYSCGARWNDWPCLIPFEGLVELVNLSAKLPAIFLADSKSPERFWEFFAANIRMPRAYYKAACKSRRMRSSRTTGPYDRRDDDVNLDEVERIKRHLAMSPANSRPGWIRCSFPVGLFHPLQHAGLSRRSPDCRQSGSHRPWRVFRPSLFTCNESASRQYVVELWC